MLKKICLAVALATSIPAIAADYYIVTPMPGKANESGITVNLGPLSLPPAVQNRGYSFDLKQALSVTGDQAYDAKNVIFGLTSGALPAGIALSSNGVLQGVSGTVNPGASFRALANYKGVTDEESFVLAVKAPAIVAELSGSAGAATAPVTDFGTKAISNGMVSKYVYLRNVGEGGVLSSDVALTSSAEAGVWKLQSVRAVNYENNGDTANCAGSGNTVTGCKAQEFTYPGAAKELRAEVWFDPVNVGTRTATLTFTHNGTNASPVSVTLSGEGTEPQPVAELSGSAGSTTAVTTDFGKKAIADGMVSKYVYLRNVGGQGVLTSDVTLSSAAEAGVWKLQNVLAVNYENNGGSAYCTGAGNALTQCKGADGSNAYAAKELRAEVWFDPSVVGTRSATLTFNHNGSNAAPVSVTLTGEGIEPQPVAEVSGSSSSTTTVNGSFGQKTTTSGMVTKYVYLRNTVLNGSVLTTDIKLTTTAEAGVFSLGNVIAVNPGDGSGANAACGGSGSMLTACKAQAASWAGSIKELRVEVRFDPVAAGQRDATLTFTHNGSNASPAAVTLTGEGTVVNPTVALSGAPGSITAVNADFGVKALNSWSEIPVYIHNTNTDGNLQVSATLAGAGDIAILTGYASRPDGYATSANCNWSASTLNGTCTAPNIGGSGQYEDMRIIVRFRPTSVGAKSATLTINHNGTNTGPYTVNFTGTGQ